MAQKRLSWTSTSRRSSTKTRMKKIIGTDRHPTCISRVQCRSMWRELRPTMCQTAAKDMCKVNGEAFFASRASPALSAIGCKLKRRTRTETVSHTTKVKRPGGHLSDYATFPRRTSSTATKRIFFMQLSSKPSHVSQGDPLLLCQACWREDRRRLRKSTLETLSSPKQPGHAGTQEALCSRLLSALALVWLC